MESMQVHLERVADLCVPVATRFILTITAKEADGFERHTPKTLQEAVWAYSEYTSRQELKKSAAVAMQTATCQLMQSRHQL